MRIVKFFALTLTVLILIFNAIPPARAEAYYLLYSNLKGVFCTKSDDPFYSGPYQAYFNVMIKANYPAVATLHTYTVINGVSDSTPPTPLSGPFTGIYSGERIDTNTPDYTAEKYMELWVDGVLRSKTGISVTCSDALTGGPSGPYGRIIQADVY